MFNVFSLAIQDFLDYAGTSQPLVVLPIKYLQGLLGTIMITRRNGVPVTIFPNLNLFFQLIQLVLRLMKIPFGFLDNFSAFMTTSRTGVFIGKLSALAFVPAIVGVTSTSKAMARPSRWCKSDNPEIAASRL